MDEYPAGSLVHNIPLLYTLGIASDSADDSGLDAALKEQAILLRSEPPALDTDQAHRLLRHIQGRDASKLPWNGRDQATRYKFRVRTAERSLLLPPRRARLPENIEPPSTPAALHSPYSPLSPVSPLYPDGLMDVQWMRKHQEHVPSVLLCFYTLTSDPTRATLCDNQIKTDVNKIRGLLSQSGYRTRLAVVLLSDRATMPVGEGLQERLSNIQRGCGLDPKAFFLVPPPKESQEELERMAENMLTTLYGLAIEYYRDLGRHARKKRSRGVAPQPTVPPTSGTSQTLSLAGWNVRYDFKSAVFAEFRQEMDNALRSFEQAYENLLSSELLEIIPSWSPRWNEARFLADVMAIRCLRCLLWNDQYSAACRRWQMHRDRIADFVDRRGRGTSNYGWEAWEARWATVMANLIERTDIPDLAPSALKLYLPPEKNVMGERLQPWELLHHTGYWYRMAANHLRTRRMYAHSMPDDDRRSPSDSPASHVASKAFTYDTYMCPDPHEEYPLTGRGGVNHSRLIIEALIRARTEFQKRGQLRLAAETSLECARELVVVKDWKNIVELLRPIWREMSFRTEGWLTIAEDLSWTLRAGAAMVGEADLVVAIDWELLNKSFTRRMNWHYNITRSLEGVAPPKSKPRIQIADGQILSFFSASFVFKTEEGKAGQSCQGQLSIKSNAQPGSAPIVFSSLQVKFDDIIHTIILQHQADSQTRQTNGNVVLSSVALSAPAVEDASDEFSIRRAGLRGEADLTLHPGQTTVFNMEIPLREPGEASAATLTVSLESDTFDLQHTLNFGQSRDANTWYVSPAARKRIPRPSPMSIRVLPRPPKLEIKPTVWNEQYYTNESISLTLEILNAEDADAVAKLSAVLVGEDPPLPSFQLRTSAPDSKSEDSFDLVSEEESSSQVHTQLGTIGTSSSLRIHVSLPPVDRSSSFDFTFRVSYHLSTDPSTPITQQVTLQLNIASPFEANYDLLPRVHPDPWPSLFDPDTTLLPTPSPDASDSSPTVLPNGIRQAWCLTTRYASFASEPLRVLDVDIILHSTPSVSYSHQKAIVTTPRGGISESGKVVRPKTIEEATFDILTQKATLDDRSQSVLDVSFIIKWQRLGGGGDGDDDDGVNVTTLPVPRFNIFGTEPRVLASVSYMATTSGSARVIMLEVMIENASNHFLTFGLSMEPSDEFAFSGPKQTTLNVLPVSRRSATYRLLPLGAEKEEAAGGGHWIKPTLVVRDKYFQKVLRVQPTAEGTRVDKDGGLLIWVPPSAEEAAEGDEGEEEEENENDDEE